MLMSNLRKMDANQPANSTIIQYQGTDDIALPSMEQSLLSLEKLDRASPELWPDQIPGVSGFASLDEENRSPPLWKAGITSQDLPYVSKLGSMSTSGLIGEVKRLHDLAYQLGLEEAREMTRGKYLNIFGSRKNR